jgi:hypothetical protein
MDYSFDAPVSGRVIKAEHTDRAELLAEKDGVVRALHKYHLWGSLDGADKVFDFKASYLLSYNSSEKITGNFFEAYRQLNIHTNTWPYFRELVSSMTSRTGLPTLTLPFKITR